LPPTNTPTKTFTNTPSSTGTQTNTATVTFSQTSTSTLANSPTNTSTQTSTHSPTNTSTQTPTSTTTNTVTNSQTNTSTNTVTNTPTILFTYTNTSTSTVSNTETNTQTNSVTSILTNTSTMTVSSTNTETNTNTTTATSINTNTSTASTTQTNTSTYTVTNSPTPSSSVTSTFSSTQTSSNTSTVTRTHTQTPTMTTSYTATSTQTNSATTTRTFSPTASSTSTTTFSPTPQGQFSVKVNVYNEAGEVVKTLVIEQAHQPINNISLSSSVITTLQGPGGTVSVYFNGTLLGTWDGTNSSDNPVSNGVYRIQVDNVSPNGAETSVYQQVTINRASAQVVVQVFNEAGELVRTIYSAQSNPVGSQLNNVALSSSFICPGKISPGTPSQAQIVLQSSTGSMSLIWDGVGQGGTYVTPGRYEIDVHWDNGQDSAYDIHRSLLVEAASTSGNLVAEPNKLTPANELTTFDGTSVPNASTVKAVIYTLAGQRVGSVQGPSGTAQAQWNAMGLASGLYLASVEVINANGSLLQRKTLKLLQIH
jgi:hypothetical protein